MKSIYVNVKDLDDNQRDIYDLKLDASFIVSGCAGSGKTSLALLRMQQLLANAKHEGRETSFYYVTFVRELVECIRREMSKIGGISHDRNDYMITYRNWEDGYISDYLQRRFLISDGHSHPYSPNSGHPIPVNENPDYLLVDECQDLEIKDIDSLTRSVRKGISFYGDDAQHIMAWEGRNPVTLGMIHDRFNLPIHSLIFNYRLPEEIARFAEHLGGRSGLSRHCRSPYHEKPFMIRVKDDEDAVDFMTKRIRNMRLSDVGIAFYRNQDVRRITRELQSRHVDASGAWSLKEEDGESPNANMRKTWEYLGNTSVKVMTYEKIKGQQFETVFLYIDEEFTPEQLKRFYVGVTRAERFLYILYKDSLPAALRQIPVSLYETSDVVRINSGVTFGPENRPDSPSSPESGESVDIGF